MGATYKIIPLNMGEYKCWASQVYYKTSPSEPEEDFVYGAFALQNNETGEVIMVDAGNVPEDEFEQYKSVFHPLCYVKGAPSLKQILEEKGIDPTKVNTVILTHLHMDHCYNVDLFPNAKVYIQKAELQHAVTPTKAEFSSYQVSAMPGLPVWMKAWGRIVCIDGDKKIADGVSVWLSPGHTPGSQMVFVDTKDGEYCIVGDNFYSQRHFDSGRMNGNFTNLEDWYKERERLMDRCEQTGCKILCNHEPAAIRVECYG